LAIDEPIGSNRALIRSAGEIPLSVVEVLMRVAVLIASGLLSLGWLACSANVTPSSGRGGGAGAAASGGPNAGGSGGPNAGGTAGTSANGGSNSGGGAGNGGSNTAGGTAGSSGSNAGGSTGSGGSNTGGSAGNGGSNSGGSAGIGGSNTGGSAGTGGSNTGGSGGKDGSAGNGGSNTGGNGGKDGSAGNGGSNAGGSGGRDSSAGNGGANTGGSTVVVDGGSVDAARQACVDRINALRASLGLGSLSRWTANETCADSQAKSDSETGTAHGAFGTCPNMAQNECQNYKSIQSTLTTCIDSMWAEGPGTDYALHGHYINITSTKYTMVSCGFYTTPAGKVWMVQDFK
jgi:hypothetical protein